MIWVDAAGVTHDQNIADVDDLQGMMGISDIRDDVNAIKGKIPAQTYEQGNELADKTFVNSSIATATATFRGSYNLVIDLGLQIGASEADIANVLFGIIQTKDNNDYCFVEIPTPESQPTYDQIEQVDRWKFNGTAWVKEYTLNNSGFTAAQWATVNSGLTGADKTKLTALPTNAQLTTMLAGKVDTVTGKGLSTEDFTTPEKTKLASAIVGATSGTNPVVGTVKVMTSAEYYALTSLDANTEYIII